MSSSNRQTPSLDASAATWSRAARRWAIGILLVAGMWRAVLAFALPCIARDGVTFCWYARDLGEHGLAYFNTPGTKQHPLYPLTILGTQRLLTTLGLPEAPLTWQVAGQIVAWIAGMAVVVLAGVLTWLLIPRIGAAVDRTRATCCAMAFAAVLPLNVQHAAEVMSDQLHLAFYLAGVCLFMRLDRWWGAAGCGLASALAFLVRPEGIAVAPAGLLVAWRDARIPGARRRAATSALILAGFLLCALPFWSLTGKLTIKKDLDHWLERSAATVAPMDAATPNHNAFLSREPRDELPNHTRFAPTHPRGFLAKLETYDLAWYAVAPWLLYVLFRAGRVVIPLLAIGPLINVRHRWLRAPLIGLAACAAMHLALRALVLYRDGYVAPRHLLVVVMLLLPFAAMLVARILELTDWQSDASRTSVETAPRRQTRPVRLSPASACIFLAMVFLPLMFRSLYLPNAADAHLPTAAAWLRDHDPSISSKRILSGSSGSRVAFYTGAAWSFWYETPEQYEAMCNVIAREEPDYFVIETGAGFEREGKAAAIERLRDEPRFATKLQDEHQLPIHGGHTLHIFTFRWPGPETQGSAQPRPTSAP